MSDRDRGAHRPIASRRDVAHAIAAAFLSGDPEPADMAARAQVAIGDERDDWLLAVAREIAEVLPLVPADVVAGVTDLILRCDSFSYQWSRPWRADQVAWRDDLVIAAAARPGPTGASRIHATTTDPSIGMVAVGTEPARWPVPPIGSVGELAAFFGLHPVHLAWYTDTRSMERDARAEPLRHYTYRWLPKRNGGARLLERPKPMLRFFQRRVLHEILDGIPAHDAAHGFRAGRSVHSFAQPHAGRDVVIRLDLESFFAAVNAGRVFSIFTRAGYVRTVAHHLTGLVTNTVPLPVLQAAPTPPAMRLDAHRRASRDLAHPHLPQGAPTSPALANLAAFGLDRRLHGLAQAFDATYTRYADDLAFSGGHRLGRAAPRFVQIVQRIVGDEGFRVNAPKSRVMRHADRQALAGLVVNDHAHVPRADYDRLRAVLHDAASHGPAAANRDDVADFRAHLLGRIAWIATSDAHRATKLQASFDCITW